MCLISCLKLKRRLKLASTESCPKKVTVLRGISWAVCTDVLVNSQVQKGRGAFQSIYLENSTAIENLIHVAPEGRIRAAVKAHVVYLHSWTRLSPPANCSHWGKTFLMPFPCGALAKSCLPHFFSKCQLLKQEDSNVLTNSFLPPLPGVTWRVCAVFRVNHAHHALWHTEGLCSL